MIVEAISERRLILSEKLPVVLFLAIITPMFIGYAMRSDVVVEPGNVVKEYVKNDNSNVKEEQISVAPLFREKPVVKKVVSAEKSSMKSDGVEFTRMTEYKGKRPVKINVIKVNVKSNPIEIIPGQAKGKMHAKSGIKGFAKSNKVKGAVNGTYFMPASGTPLGTLMINGKIISGPVYNRASFLIYDNKFGTARVGFEGTLSVDGRKIKIDNINQPRMSKNDIIIYTKDWGVNCPKNESKFINVAISNGEITAVSKEVLKIPSNGYVISGLFEKLNEINIGQKAEVTYGLTGTASGVRHIISGGPYLLKQGKTYIDTASEKLKSIDGRNPRTAVGYTKDGTMIAVVVEGRKEGSSGMTLNELASLMKKLGCYEAINLDGGSSSVMYYNGNIYGGTNFKGASVSNALIIRKKQS